MRHLSVDKAMGEIALAVELRHWAELVTVDPGLL